MRVRASMLHNGSSVSFTKRTYTFEQLAKFADWKEGYLVVGFLGLEMDDDKGIHIMTMIRAILMMDK